MVLDPVDLGGSAVTITSGGTTRTRRVLLHVNERRDINALQLLRSDAAVADFWALDGEADEAVERSIFALEVASLVAINVTLGSDRSLRQVAPEQLTEHCRFLVDQVRRRMNANSDHRGILSKS